MPKDRAEALCIQQSCAEAGPSGGEARPLALLRGGGPSAETSRVKLQLNLPVTGGCSNEHSKGALERVGRDSLLQGTLMEEVKF